MAAVTGLGAESVAEHEVKAAMLFNFVKFVDWPQPMDSKAPLSLCVAGADALAGALEQAVADRTVGGRPLKVQRGQKVADLKGCQLLFVAGGERKQVREVVDAPPQAGLLTVSDAARFATEGGVVGFVSEDKKIRFEVNLAAAERAKLHVSARMLQLARVVHRASPGGER